MLEGKRDKLMEQLEEAKRLKENIDRRSRQVADLLSRYLTEEEFADYSHFVTMKAKLVIDQREIDEKIKLGDEQLAALRETLHLGRPRIWCYLITGPIRTLLSIPQTSSQFEWDLDSFPYSLHSSPLFLSRFKHFFFLLL